MLKSLTFGLSLVLALGLTGVSKAGGFFGKEAGCTTCGLASPQGDPGVSPQSPAPSPQGGSCLPTIKKCDIFAGLGHKLSCLHSDLEGFKHSLCEKLKPKPKVYTYEWVLKKKRVWGHHGLCSSPSCDTCGTLPSSQSYPSAQGGASPQAGGCPQAGYSSPVPTSYGSGQIVASPISSIPAAPLAADEPPPAPAVPAATPATPAATNPAPEPPAAPEVPKTSLLFSTPSGN